MEPLDRNPNGERVLSPPTRRTQVVGVKFQSPSPVLINGTRADAKAPTHQSESRRREEFIVWVLITMLVALGCGALYLLWMKSDAGL